MPGYVTDVSYARRFQRELAPAWLDCVAVLCGIRPPSRQHGFSWCDLGCGPGLTAVVLAATHPGGRFHGVDQMPAHVAHARQLAAVAGIATLQLHQTDFAALDLGDVRFDYMAAHGVYAWIDADSRAALRRLINRHLAPGGLLYLSYNAMPGWAADLPLQRLLLALAEDLPGDSIERFGAALALLQEIAAAGAPSLTASPMAGRLAEPQKHHSAAYLAHEYLAGDWQPLFVTDVRREMAEIGLSPVGSASFTDNFDSFALRRVERDVLDRFTDPNKRELVRDYLLNQRFRRDVYSRDASQLDDDERRERLTAMRYALAAPAETVEFTMRTPAGRLNFDTAAARAVVAALAGGPRCLSEIRFGTGTPDDLLSDLLALCCAGAVRPVAAGDADVGRLNRAILDRFGGSEQIDYLALSCGTAVAVKPAIIAALRGNGRDADQTVALWSDYLLRYAQLGR